MVAEMSPALTARLRERVRELFVSYIEAERLAAASYQQGAKERQGPDSDLYLLYGATSERRVFDWQQLQARLDFDLFVGPNRLDALLVTEGPTEHEQEEEKDNAGLPRLHSSKVTRDA